MDKGLIVLGAGTFAQEVTDLAEESGHKVVGYVVNREPWKLGERLLERPVYHTILSDLWPNEGWADFPCVGAIISPERETLCWKMQSLGYSFESVIHPSASVSKTGERGYDLVISRNVVVSSHVKIGDHVILNRGALVGHHCTLMCYATIGPGAVLCGDVTIGQRATVGANATVLEGCTVGAFATVGAGAVVTKNVRPGVTVVGVPAKEMLCLLGKRFELVDTGDDL